MKSNLKYSLFPLIILILILASCSRPPSLSELDPYLKKSVSWKCNKLNKEIPLKIYFLDDITGDDGAEVIVYVKNRAWERVGQESDLSILSDNIQKKFIVITVDFGNEPRPYPPLLIMIFMTSSGRFTVQKPNLCLRTFT